MKPTETQWHFDDNQTEYWQWSARTLCPPCRVVQRDFWLGKPRRRDQVVQLRLVSDVEAPLVAIGELQLRRERPSYRKWLASPWNELG